MTLWDTWILKYAGEKHQYVGDDAHVAPQYMHGAGAVPDLPEHHKEEACYGSCEHQNNRRERP